MPCSPTHLHQKSINTEEGKWTPGVLKPSQETPRWVYMETQHHRGPNVCLCVCTRVSLRRVCVHVCVWMKSELVLRKVGIELLQHIQEQGLQTQQFQTSLSVVDLWAEGRCGFVTSCSRLHCFRQACDIPPSVCPPLAPSLDLCLGLVLCRGLSHLLLRWPRLFSSSPCAPPHVSYPPLPSPSTSSLFPSCARHEPLPSVLPAMQSVG